MSPFQCERLYARRDRMEQALILATAGAAMVFVVWVMLAGAIVRWWERRQSREYPDWEPTPEDYLRAQSLGLEPPKR